ncbi:MAG TPA: ABC transporter substrate-binding protein, partial [Homoserinimonas sp.]|nr:ABC transporter substrate-binding protein [Homoserinimonas sp.]
MPLQSQLRNRHRTIATAAALATLALLASGCSAEPTAPTGPVSGGILVYATGDAEPTCLDPHVGGNYPQALVATQYLESLVSKDAGGEVIPWLATEWAEAEDGLSWEFTLRDDVSFTDGTPLTAEAVQANVEHLLDPATASSTGYLALGKVASTDIVDEHTIRFNLSAPDSSLLDSLSMPWLAIQSPTALERGMEVNCESPVGTGPFIVDGWAKQDSITLVRNDDYNSPPADAGHDGVAWLDQIIWRFIPDSASRYSALQGGQVDVIDNAQPGDIAAAASVDNITELDAPRPGASNRIELNSGKAPFDDVRVREAFIRAADVNDGIQSLFFGTADRSYSLLSSVEALGVSGEEYFTVDPNAANSLLDAAGWTERDGEGYRVKNGER